MDRLVQVYFVSQKSTIVLLLALLCCYQQTGLCACRPGPGALSSRLVRLYGRAGPGLVTSTALLVIHSIIG